MTKKKTFTPSMFLFGRHRRTWTRIRWSGSPWQRALWIQQPQGQTWSLSGTVSPTLSVALRGQKGDTKLEVSM